MTKETLLKLLCGIESKSSVLFRLVLKAASHLQKVQSFTFTCEKCIQRSMWRISRSLSRNEEEKIVANGQGKRGRETHTSAVDLRLKSGANSCSEKMPSKASHTWQRSSTSEHYSASLQRALWPNLPRFSSTQDPICISCNVSLSGTKLDCLSNHWYDQERYHQTLSAPYSRIPYC
jgi:hypothetical protein